MRSLISFPLLCLGGVAAAVACGKSSGDAFPSPTDDDSGTNDDGGDPMLPGADAADGPSCTTCSADLHDIVTCGDNPQLVQACTGTQGCGAMGCVDACDAAAGSKSSIGCDYYAIPPDAWTHKSCFAAFVTNTWNAPLKVSLVWKGTTIDATPYSYIPKGSGSSLTYQPVGSTGIPANGMAIVFLNQMPSSDGFHISCPAGTKAAIESEDVEPSGTSFGHAIEIKTSVPAVVYDIYPYGGALSYMSSATLLFPTTAWDTNFVATTMAETPAATPGIDFVAQQDGTTVTVLPTTDITALNGVAGTTKGVPVTYKINKGQMVHLLQAVDTSSMKDLSGSIIQSNNPIGVWGEHFCMVQNTSPPNWRLVGAVKGTNLTYDPPVAGAPTTLTEGQMVEFPGPEAFHVKSQDNMHPFYLAAHRPGGDCDAAHQQIPPIQALGDEYVAVANETTNYGMGGPETVNVVPPAEFLSQYTFFTDPTYPYTDLALVRKKAADGTYKDVTLDCLTGKVTGWLPIGTSPYQYTHVDVQQNGMPVGKCDNGLHSIKSDGPLGITVWGYGSAVSYAYPAGASVKAINTVVVPPVPN